MCIFIDFWKIEIKNSILHVFNFFHKLSFDNSFCFLSILSCQTSFLISKVENYFWKQKIRRKTVTKHTLIILTNFLRCGFFFFFLLYIFKKEMSNNFMLIKLTFCQIFNQFYKI